MDPFGTDFYPKFGHFPKLTRAGRGRPRLSSHQVGRQATDFRLFDLEKFRKKESQNQFTGTI
jgi:hypothetical protein